MKFWSIPKASDKAGNITTMEDEIETVKQDKRLE